jgi:hypothetical protein
MPRSEILRRIEIAIGRTDVGITTGQLKANFLNAMNRALRSVGGMTVQSLDDEGALYRAMLRLEAA